MSGGCKVSDRVLHIQKSAIHEMTRLSKEVEDVAFLSWAKPTTDTPEHIKRGAIRAIEEGFVGGYSDVPGLPELREEIARKLKRDNGIDANPAQVLATVGAIEGLSAAVMAVVDPGDEVILPTPTYSTHIRQVVIASGKPVFVPTIEEEGFALDMAKLKDSITDRTRAILFCTPSNPTGTVFPEEHLREMAAIAAENDLAIITDEAYEYFTYDGQKHFSVGSVPEVKKNVISCFTFTKTYAMTGWRIGYVHADEELMPQISKAHIPFAICAPVVSQFAALAALQGSQDCISEFRQHYLEVRDLMCERLDALDSVFEYQKPGGAYLMFPKILPDEGKDSLSFCKKLLTEAKVSATPGIAFGPTGEGHLRLSFCVPHNEVNKAFDRMEKYFG
jgi:aminotransferase